MTDKPITFSGPMVRALLDGRKTQTRRVLRKQPPHRANLLRIDGPTCFFCDGEHAKSAACEEHEYEVALRYPPGDRLYVQENWRACRSMDRMSPSDMRAGALEAGYRRAWAPILYEADGAFVNSSSETEFGRFRSPRHMLREFSRLTLTVTDVCVQRLQEISEEDARAEGVDAVTMADVPRQAAMSRRSDFAALWNSLHGPDAWAANPWVAALTFTVERRNIDEAQP